MTLLSNLFQPINLKSSVPKFWAWFESQSQTLFQLDTNQQAVIESLTGELKKVNEHLSFEMGPDVEGVRELIISADGFKDAIPAVQELVKQAPKLENWEVIPFRQALPLVLTVYYGNVILPPEDLWFSAEQKGGKVDLHLYANGYLPTKKNDYLAASFLLLDHLLGEYTVMTKMGAIDIDILPADPPAAGLKQFGDLKAEFK